jgi:hypothetical protein
MMTAALGDRLEGPSKQYMLYSPLILITEDEHDRNSHVKSGTITREAGSHPCTP